MSTSFHTLHTADICVTDCPCTSTLVKRITYHQHQLWYLFFSRRISRFRVVSSMTADVKFPFRTILSSLEFKACTESTTYS